MVEVAVGIGLVAVVTVAVVATQLMVTRDQVQLRNQLDESIDETLAERIIFNDFSAIDPSYNNINVNDDAGLNFFDFYPDVPANSITGALGRTITLKGTTGATNSVMLVSQDLAAGATLIYDPTAAYEIGATPGDFNQAASLTFKSLNNNSWLTGVNMANRPGFWQNGVTLMLDTPAKIRPLLANGSLNMAVAPRSPTFVGIVQGDTINTIANVNELSGLFRTTQPDTGAQIPSADAFFRGAPSIGGGQTLTRVKAVKVTKYFMTEDKTVPADCIEGNKTYYHSKFYKVVYRSNGFATPSMLANNVCSFVMYRDSVLKRMIYFKINKVQDLKKAAGS